MMISKMSIVQIFHCYSDTVVVVVAVGEFDDVAGIGEKNKLISTIWMTSIFGLVETARWIFFFLLGEMPHFAFLFFWSYLIIGANIAAFKLYKCFMISNHFIYPLNCWAIQPIPFRDSSPFLVSLSSSNYIRCTVIYALMDIEINSGGRRIKD